MVRKPQPQAIMRGADTFTESLFTMRKLEDFVPGDHPLRPIRKMANAALAKMEPLFARMYEADIKGWRPIIAPEKLLPPCLPLLPNLILPFINLSVALHL